MCMSCFSDGARAAQAAAAAEGDTGVDRRALEVLEKIRAAHSLAAAAAAGKGVGGRAAVSRSVVAVCDDIGGQWRVHVAAVAAGAAMEVDAGGGGRNVFSTAFRAAVAGDAVRARARTPRLREQGQAFCVVEQPRVCGCA